jgi:hypothetical protein
MAHSLSGATRLNAAETVAQFARREASKAAIQASTRATIRGNTQIWLDKYDFAIVR